MKLILLEDPNPEYLCGWIRRWIRSNYLRPDPQFCFSHA